MTPYDFIDGFRIGESGYWEPLPCQMCNGQKVVSRKLTSGPLYEQGYDFWCEPCGRCYGYGMRMFEEWVKNTRDA